MLKSLKINLVCNWYTQISSLIDLLKQSIKARGIQRLVVPPHPNPLTKENWDCLQNDWEMKKKNGSNYNASKFSEKMRKLTVFHIHFINLQSSHKAHHANLWPHATNVYLSRSV